MPLDSTRHGAPDYCRRVAGILDGGVLEQMAQLERARTAQLEQALVSALLRGANWKVTSGEQERLREGCLTRNAARSRMEKCRSDFETTAACGWERFGKELLMAKAWLSRTESTGRVYLYVLITRRSSVQI